MKYDEFIIAVESICGRYTNDILKKLVIKYIMESWQENDLDNVFKKFSETFHVEYGKQPGVSVFADIYKQQNPLEAKAEQAWSDMLPFNSGHSVLLADPASQEAIKSMGGWDEFCEYRARDNAWCHTHYISRYINLQQSSRHAGPEVLKSFSAKYYRKPIAREDVKVIGDQARGQVMLEIAMQNISGYLPGLKQISDLIKIPQEATR
jgi:hypothetical protein